MDPLTPLDTLCRIILRGREYEAQTPTDYDGNEAADNVDDATAGKLSFDISQKIEKEMQYPGQIKVVVIRETRAVDFAR